MCILRLYDVAPRGLEPCEHIWGSSHLDFLLYSHFMLPLLSQISALLQARRGHINATTSEPLGGDINSKSVILGMPSALTAAQTTNKVAEGATTGTFPGCGDGNTDSASGVLGAPLGDGTPLTDFGDLWDDDFLTESAAPMRAAPSGSTKSSSTAEGGGGGDADEEGPEPGGNHNASSGKVTTGGGVAAATIASGVAGPGGALPALTLLGTRHQSGLTADGMIAYAPLDEAIVRAVEKGRSTEVKRRLYGSILLLGGVARTPGLKEYLEWRLASCWKLAPDSTEGIERVEVAPLPAGVSPETLVWRGGAVLTSLEGARAQWVMAKEWRRVGVIAARAACGFSW